MHHKINHFAYFINTYTLLFLFFCHRQISYHGNKTKNAGYIYTNQGQTMLSALNSPSSINSFILIKTEREEENCNRRSWYALMDTATATEDLSNVLRLLYVAYDGTELGCKDVVGSIQHVYRDQGKEFLTV